MLSPFARTITACAAMLGCAIAAPLPANAQPLAKFIKLMLQFSSVEGGGQDFKICLTKNSDATFDLSSINGVIVNERRIDVTVTATAGELTSACNLIFLAENEVKAIDHYALAKQGVLTVSDAVDFAKNDGVLEVELQGEKIAFYVGMSHLRKTTVAPNSKFLRMATQVY